MRSLLDDFQKVHRRINYTVLDEYSIEKGFLTPSSFNHCSKLLYSSDSEAKAPNKDHSFSRFS